MFRGLTAALVLLVATPALADGFKVQRTYECDSGKSTRVTETIEDEQVSYELDAAVCGNDSIEFEVREPSAERFTFYRCVAGFDTYFEVWENGSITSAGHINMSCATDMSWWEGHGAR